MEIIKELIEIESKTDARVTEAREGLKRLGEEMLKKETEIRNNIDNKTTDNINKLIEAANSDSARKIAEIKQNSDFLTASLEKLFEQNRAKWEAEIVKQAIGM